MRAVAPGYDDTQKLQLWLRGAITSVLFLTCAPASVLAVTPAIATGAGTTACALTSAGGVKCWGGGTLAPAEVDGFTGGVVAIAVGSAHVCALSVDGGAKCRGYNAYGQVGDGTTSTVYPYVPVSVVGLVSNVASIATGSYHTCAVDGLGALKCWGYNSFGQLGDGSTIDRSTPVDVSSLSSGVTALAANFSYTCAVLTNGGVKCWGGYPYRSRTPAVISGLNGVTAIAAGDSNTCAIIAGGGVTCWGYSQIPGVVGGLVNVAAITAGDYHTCVLTASGGVKCWGENGKGQLGDGTYANRQTPVDVSGLASGVTAISAGGNYTCALTSIGGVKCWGENGSGQLGDGTTVSRFVPAFVANLNLLGGPTLGSSSNPSTYAQSVTFTAIVTGGSTPTGTVNFKSGAATIGGCGAVLVTGGQAACTVNNLSVGNRIITAMYSGDAANPSATSDGMIQAVMPVNTATTLDSTVNPTTFGQGATFTATVTGLAPTGTVAFKDGVTTMAGCGSRTVVASIATCSTSTLSAANHGITAVYSGDSNNAASTSAAFDQLVNRANSTLTMVASGPIHRGQHTTVTVTVSSGVGTPTGSTTVTGSGVGCTATLVAGSGSCLLVPTTVGANQPLTGNYGGDGSHGVASGATQVTVKSTLDVDDNGISEASTDGVLIMRYLFGLTGAALTNGAIGSAAKRSAPADIAKYLGEVRPLLDIDGDAQVDALTDGLLIIRFLFGIRDTALIQGAVGSTAQRNLAGDIERHIEGLIQ